MIECKFLSQRFSTCMYTCTCIYNFDVRLYKHIVHSTIHLFELIYHACNNLLYMNEAIRQLYSYMYMYMYMYMYCNSL